MEVIGFDAYGFILAVIDGDDVVIPDDASNRHRRLVAEWEANGNVIPPYVPPPAPPYTIDADVPWSRMTDDEAVLAQSAIDASPIKTKNMINKAISFTEGTDAFIKLMDILSTVISPSRAAEILSLEG